MRRDYKAAPKPITACGPSRRYNPVFSTFDSDVNGDWPLAALAGVTLFFGLAGNSPAATPATAQQSAPLPEAGHSTIGYQTVAEALAALRSNPNYTVYEQQGWTLARNKSGLVIWSFPPATNPAYPSAVKRAMVRGNDGSWNIKMAVLCEAGKGAGDHLVRQFEELNKQMIHYIRKEHKKTSPSHASTAGSG